MQRFSKVIGRAQSSGAHACRCTLARHDCSSVCLLAKKFPPTPTLPRLHAFFVGMLGRGKNWAVGLIGSRLGHSPVNTTFDTVCSSKHPAWPLRSRIRARHPKKTLLWHVPKLHVGSNHFRRRSGVGSEASPTRARFSRLSLPSLSSL